MAALKALVIFAVVAACLAEEPAQTAERTKKGIIGAGYGLAPYTGASVLPSLSGAYGSYYNGYGSAYGSSYPYNHLGAYSVARSYPYHSGSLNAIGAYPYHSAAIGAYPYHSSAIGAYPYHSSAIGAYPYHSAAIGAYPYHSSGYGYPLASRVY